MNPDRIVDETTSDWAGERLRKVKVLADPIVVDRRDELEPGVVPNAGVNYHSIGQG